MTLELMLYSHIYIYIYIHIYIYIESYYNINHPAVGMAQLLLPIQSLSACHTEAMCSAVFPESTGGQ